MGNRRLQHGYPDRRGRVVLDDSYVRPPSQLRARRSRAAFRSVNVPVTCFGSRGPAFAAGALALGLAQTLGEVVLADPAATVDSLRTSHERVPTAERQQEHLIEAPLTLARSERDLDEREPFDLAAYASAARRDPRSRCRSEDWPGGPSSFSPAQRAKPVNAP
jgi:hypothetical protein